MAKSEALRRAKKRYDRESRKRVSIGTRVDPETLQKIDKKRGKISRSALVNQLLNDWLDND